MLAEVDPTRRSTFRRVVWPSIAIMSFFAVTASAFVWWHYYICKSPGDATVRHWYAHQSDVPGKGVPGYIDMALPAIVLGFVTGVAGARLTPRWTAIHVVLMSVGIMALQPVLVRWMPADELWWMPADRKWPPLTTLRLGFFVAVWCAVFAYLGRLYGQRWWGLGDNSQAAGG